MGEFDNKIKEIEDKPRCKACYECPMGVIGCEWDDKPHGHGCGQRCQECGVTYYHVHPHSNVCSRGTPVTNNVRHDYSHMKHQLKWKVAYDGTDERVQ